MTALPHPAIAQVVDFLDRTLAIKNIADESLNGLQVMGERPVRVVAGAVDASMTTFAAAQAAGADLLLVHHGLFWGKAERLVGIAHQRIRFLIQKGLGLYAAHLPLDLHPQVGNNIQLAKGLGLTRIKPFGTYQGIKIGFGGSFSQPRTLVHIVENLQSLTVHSARLMAFGPKKIKRLAVVSGGAGKLFYEASQEGYQAFITGEISHEIFHPARELGLNLIIGGHYATETLGIKALLALLKKKFGIKGVFLDFPTLL